MLRGYFEDIYLTMHSISSVLNPAGWVAMIVGNVRYAGVNVPVDEIVAEIGVQVGMKSTHIWTARLKGNSSQQMMKFKRRPNRESIVLWQLSKDNRA